MQLDQIHFADSVTFVAPFRNWDTDVLRISLESLKQQTTNKWEYILVDLESNPDCSKEAHDICSEYKTKYNRFSFGIPETIKNVVIEVYLWNIILNYGARLGKGDLIFFTGVDRIYEKNTVQQILNDYNKLKRNSSKKKRPAKDIFIASKVWNLYRTPKIEELNNFDDLIEEATWRGGFGYWGSSKEWMYEVRGLDENIRWYEDLDMLSRARRDKLITYWQFRENRVLHLANHPTHRYKFKNINTVFSNEIKKISRKGKRGISFDPTIVRNDNGWGTTEKIMEKIKKIADNNPELFI